MAASTETDEDLVADLVTLRPAEGPAKGTLFCVHGAGGGVMYMVPVARKLDPSIEVLGFQAHGFMPARTPDDSIDLMAARYAAEIRRRQPEGPYQVIGYSLGGVVAHEVARRLRESGAEVSLVGLLDTMLPGMSTIPSNETALELVSIALMFPELYRCEPGLSWDDQISRFLAVAVKERILPPRYDRVKLQRMVDLHRINREALERHTVRPIDCPVRLLVAADGLSIDAVPQWMTLSGPGSTVTKIDAEHFTLMTRNIDEVAAAIGGWLSESTTAVA